MNEPDNSSSLEEDATAGAADPMDLTSSENTDASAGQTEDPELMESNTPMMLGRYQTNLTVEQTADMSRQWDEEHAGEAEGAAVLTGASLDAHEVDDDRSDEQLNNDDLAVDIPTRSRSYGTGSHGNRLMGNLDHRRSTPRYQDRPMPYAQAPTFMPVSRDPRLRPPPPGDFPTRDRIGAANAYRPAPYHARSSGAGPNEANAYGPGPHHARQDGNRANVTLAQQATPFAQKQHHGNRFEHKPEETSSQKAGLRRSLDEIIAEGKAPRDEKRGPFDPYANERAANSKHRQTRKSGRR